MGHRLTSKPVPGDFNGICNAIAALDNALNTGASPEFAGFTLTGLTANALIYPTSAGVLTSLSAATNGQLIIGSTGVAPSVASLTGTANQIVVTAGAGSITLSTPQDIHTGASPTFNNLSLEGGIPKLVFKDNTDTGDSARGFQEWRDSNNVRLGFFGNHSYTNDDLKWKNESSGGHLLLETIGGGFFEFINGNVGIGTDGPPTAKLDVAGSANITNTATVGRILAGGVV